MKINSHSLSHSILEKLKVVLFIAPLLIPLLTFWIVPFGWSIYISFTDWDYISPEYSYVGLENYQYMFEDSYFMDALNNTFVFALGVVIPTIMLGLAFVLLLHKNFRGSQLYRAVIFSPWITPTVAVSVDTPMNLYHYPANKFVAGFIGSPAMNLIHATLIQENNLTYVQLDNGSKLALLN